MPGLQSILAIIFILGMGVFLWVRRKNIEFHRILPGMYFAMYKSKLGLKAMDWIGNRGRRMIKPLSYFGIVLGFAGMAWIVYELLKASALLITQPELPPTVQPVLPFAVKGVFFVPFIYWILSIFVIAVVHEFAHGVVARAHNIPVKSSGFAFFSILVPLIPAAFVEPSEQKLVKRPGKEQLAVFAAGPFANVLLAALVIFAFGFELPPLVTRDVTSSTAIVDLGGAAQDIIIADYWNVTAVTANSPAAMAGLVPGSIITSIDGVAVREGKRFAEKVDSLKPGQVINVGADDREIRIPLIADTKRAEKGVMGVSVKLHTLTNPTWIAKYGDNGVQAIIFAITLAIWLYALSLGIGLFNLVPLGPIDGGRMFKLAAERTMNEATGVRVWKATSLFFLVLILFNIAVGFIR
ncbi:site-2 protease family protein [Candidatus Woesearchaeota archaeon]|nr:site-2 protease family protein [Candidatus Woesearchaeota archaeon]